MAAHSEIGASGMYRWSVCPGSVRESRDAENVSSSYALEGSAAHALAETFYSEGGSALAAVGRTIKLDEGTVEVTEEMATAVDVYLEFIRALAAKADVCDIEHKFDLTELFDGLFGTSDFFAIEGDTLDVVDYKHGAGKWVDVVRNPQLMYYALGVVLTLGEHLTNVTKVRMTIVQPRCSYGEPIRSWTINLLELLDFQEDLVAYAKATQAPDAPLVPGDHCGFCPAAPKCPALQQRAHDAFVEALTAAEPKVRAAQEPMQTYAQYLAEWLWKLDTIEAFCKTIREESYRVAAGGTKIPGHKLVAKEGRRAWADVEKVKSFLLAQGIDPAEMFEPPSEPKLKSPAQMEKLEQFKGKANAEAKTALGAFAPKVSSGTVLVPEGDSRPEYDGSQAFDKTD